MSEVLSELHYLPSIETFAYYAKADTILLEAFEHYQKGSYRNRCHLVGANGFQRLSIPLLKGKHSSMPIKKVELAFYEPWLKQHWKSIRSAYGNAPFFFYYSDAFEAIYAKEHEFLWSFNLELFHIVFKLLQWNKPIIETDSYQRKTVEGIVDIRNQIAVNRTAENNQLYFPSYPQVFTERHGFISNLSILDLLFCMGPQSNLYLQKILPS